MIMLLIAQRMFCLAMAIKTTVDMLVTITGVCAAAARWKRRT